MNASDEDLSSRRVAPEGGALSLGAWCNLADPDVVELMARAGFDWLCLDLQHGAHDDRSLIEVLRCRPQEQAVLVRVLANDPSLIGRALDAGAAGVIVPMVQGVKDAKLAVDAARYAPTGRRSWGPMATLRGDAPLSAVVANVRLVCAVMVETPAAVLAVGKIASVAGVDAVFVGPFDLALACGTTVQGLIGDPAPDSPLRRVVAACRHAGVVAGAYAGSLEVAVPLVSLGFTMIAVASDSDILGRGAKSVQRDARVRLATEGPGRADGSAQ